MVDSLMSENAVLREQLKSNKTSVFGTNGRSSIAGPFDPHESITMSQRTKDILIQQEENQDTNDTQLHTREQNSNSQLFVKPSFAQTQGLNLSSVMTDDKRVNVNRSGLIHSRNESFEREHLRLKELLKEKEIEVEHLVRANQELSEKNDALRISKPKDKDYKQ